jgi:Novel toxin 21
MRLKSCHNSQNDCTTYLEYGNTRGYAPSQVYAQGCGSFSVGGGSYSGSPSYTPPVTTPSTPTSYVPPVNGYVGNSGNNSILLTSRLSELENQFSSGHVDVIEPIGNPSVVDQSIRDTEKLIEYIYNGYKEVRVCLIKPNWIDKIGCSATSSTYEIALNNLKNIIGMFIEGLGDGLGQSFTWENILLAVSVAVATGGLSEIFLIITGIVSIIWTVVDFFTSGEATYYLSLSYGERAKYVGTSAGKSIGLLIFGAVASRGVGLGKSFKQASVTVQTNLQRQPLAKIWQGQRISADIPIIIINRNGTMSWSKFELFSFAKNNSDDIILNKVKNQLKSGSNKDTFSEFLEVSGKITNSQAAKIASQLGYQKTGFVTPQGGAVFKNSSAPRDFQYISPDKGSGGINGSHNGAYWKAAPTPEGLASKNTRTGSYSMDLQIKIGD